MFYTKIVNDLPYAPRSPYETNRSQLQLLFHRALDTECLLRFTLERLSQTPQSTAKIEATFEVFFGHFGFKIRGVTKEANRQRNWAWVPHGRLIDFDSFHKGLSKLQGMWMINHLVFTPMSMPSYRSVPDCEEPIVYTSPPVWSSYLLVRHPFGYDEGVPIRREKKRVLLARWYQILGQSNWHMEWVHVPSKRLVEYSTKEYLREWYRETLPLIDDNPLISDFLGPTALYIPPNFVPSLMDVEKRKQLHSAIWWMENRFRIVPRYPKSQLNRLVAITCIVRDKFVLPMMEETLSTTEILSLYSERGNSILRWLTTRPRSSVGGEHA